VSQLMTQLHKSVEIVQKEMDVTKEDINKVMFAEIASRLVQNNIWSDKNCIYCMG